MLNPDRTEIFVQRLTESQNRLYGYIYSLLGDHGRAADVLQETNVVLWRKLDEYELERDFLPWAFAIARFQVLAHLRDQKRDRLLLDSQLAEQISAEAERQSEHLDRLREALRKCLDSLSTENRDLIAQRYIQGKAIGDLSSVLSRTAGSVKVALLRARRQLAACVNKRMAAEGDQ